ncbi:MAG: hypothetical protein ACLQF0_04640 [Dissulfurispiraceae bacterium]
MQMSTASIKIYNILKHKFSEEESEEIVSYLENIPKEGLTKKEDLLDVKQEIREDIFDLKESMSKLDKKVTIFFIVLLAVTCLMNLKSVELIGKISGIAR